MTQKGLDEPTFLTQYRYVKFFVPAMMITACGILPLAVSCKPQAPDVEKLNAIKQQNDQLRREIQAMQTRIRQAGNDLPELPEQITQRTAEVTDALKSFSALQEEETNLKLRAIELEGRLRTFRNTFNEMKKNVANPASI